MDISLSIAKNRNRKTPEPQSLGFFVSSWTLSSFLPTAIIAYASDDIKYTLNIKKSVSNYLYNNYWSIFSIRTAGTVIFPPIVDLYVIVDAEVPYIVIWSSSKTREDTIFLL